MLGVRACEVEEGLLATKDVTSAASASRHLVGCLKEATAALRGHLQRPERPRLGEASLTLANFIYSTTVRGLSSVFCFT